MPAFASEWIDAGERSTFDEVNDLIDRHNRWYPVESRLPMDPRTGEYALVNGGSYRSRHLDAAWVARPLSRRLSSATGVRSASASIASRSSASRGLILPQPRGTWPRA